MTSPHRTCGKLDHYIGCECDRQQPKPKTEKELADSQLKGLRSLLAEPSEESRKIATDIINEKAVAAMPLIPEQLGRMFRDKIARALDERFQAGYAACLKTWEEK